MFDIPVRDLGDMHKAVLMDSDINKHAEINNISHRSFENHALF